MNKLSSNNPREDKFAEQFNQLQQRVRDLELSVQPQAQDWTELNTSLISYSSNDVFTYQGSNPELFQVGDKIRINQGGFKYFYVINKSGNTVTLNAGSDYTYTSATISSFSISKIRNPSGHPNIFNYSPTVRNDITSAVIPTTKKEVKYAMNANVITIFYDIRNTSMGGVSPSLTGINFTAPFPSRAVTPNVTFSSQLGRCAFVSSQSTSQALYFESINSGSIRVLPISNEVANSIFVFDGKIDYIY